jgi:23S rRNA pseudouridine1911/1915/1917 synthase
MITEVVPAGLAGERVDRVVAFMADCSRAEAAALIGDRAVRRNGIPVKKGADKVVEGDVIEADPSSLEHVVGLLAEADMEIDVLYADDDVIVVDKAANVVVHPGTGTPEHTLVNGLLASFPEIAQVGDPERPGIVHRLDKGTTGVLMVARTQSAYESLVDQLRDHSVERQYFAVVVGHLENDRGVIDASLGRSRRNPLRQAVVAGGREARTHYEVISRHSSPFPISVVRCRLETGRTHQIRVHLSAIDHSVVADDVYGRGHPPVSIDRPALHAETLGFVHPKTGQAIRFSSPVPRDLQALLDVLD